MLVRVGRRRPAAHRHLYYPDDFLWPYQLNPKPLCIAEFQSDKDFSLLSPFPLRVAVLNLDTWTISGLYVWLLLLTTHKDIWGTEKTQLTWFSFHGITEAGVGRRRTLKKEGKGGKEKANVLLSRPWGSLSRKYLVTPCHGKTVMGGLCPFSDHLAWKGPS